MKFKVLAVVLAALGLIVAGVVRTSSKVQQGKDSSPSNNRLHGYAEKAKREKQSKVSVPSLEIDYPGSANSFDLQHALAACTIVIAQPVEHRTYQLTDNDLFTWYKFKVLDYLSDKKSPACILCDRTNPPQEFLPLASDEILVSKFGGQMLIDGVQVEQSETGLPPYQIGQKYLLFLSLEPSGVASTAGGPLGVFTVSEDGTFSPVNNAKHPLKEDLKKHFSNSIEPLRVAATQSV